MSRYRLYPTPEQEAQLRDHCGHARFVWNLCVEQQSWWRPGRGPTPTWAQRSRQLTEARAEFEWLRDGARVVQEQALRDFDQALTNYFRRTHRAPTWRKAGRDEGFRIQGVIGKDWDVKRLSRKVGAVHVAKIGWVRFRWSRTVPECKSFRVTLDRAGRWHIAFAAIPQPIPGPGTGDLVGIDRGVVVSAALSTGDLLHCPKLTESERTRQLRLERKAARQRVRGRRASGRLRRTYAATGALRARAADRRKAWVEETSTDLARQYDVIRVEDLKIRRMTRSAKGTVAEPGKNVAQKSGLNREILGNGWGLLVKRLEDKAPGRVEKVPVAFTSQRCSACGHIAAESRKSQALFVCVACNFACHADVNAAKNIAAGYAVNARGADRVAGAVNREPQHGSPVLESAA